MVALARAHILTCGDFLLVQDLANHLGIHVELLSPALKGWEADHRIFSIDHDGCRSFPVYAFPSQGGASPIPGLRDVLSVLCPMKDGKGVSFWFISPNAWLEGKRPQDLLSTEPSRVFAVQHMIANSKKWHIAIEVVFLHPHIGGVHLKIRSGIRAIKCP
ncbi:hypothetical protein [Pseudomonas sp. S2_B07]